MQELKYLRKIRPLLSRLRKVGTECDRAGNHRLFMDQYCALILMSLYSPAIESLRDLQRACALDKVRKRLGVTRASLGSLSESVAIFDPAPLKEIAVKRVAELAWTPMAGGQKLSAYRLHTHFEVLSGKPVRMNATSANTRGEVVRAGAATVSSTCGVRCYAGLVFFTQSPGGVARVLERRRRPAETWMSEHRRLRVSEGLEGRSERPARGYGQPRPSQDAHLFTRQLPCRTGLPPWP
ncbi:MAG: hypothetical protein WCO90_07815 [Planctomycetota bacterium]